MEFSVGYCFWYQNMAVIRFDGTQNIHRVYLNITKMMKTNLPLLINSLKWRSFLVPHWRLATSLSRGVAPSDDCSFRGQPASSINSASSSSSCLLAAMVCRRLRDGGVLSEIESIGEKDIIITMFVCSLYGVSQKLGRIKSVVVWHHPYEDGKYLNYFIE